MTVQDTLPLVVVPRQAAPEDRSTTCVAAAPVPAPLLGRDRPLTTDERQFAVGLACMVLVLGTIIVVGLLLAQYAWA